MNKRIAIPLVALFALVLTSASFAGYRAFAREAPARWPSFTMTYSLTGDFATVGDTAVTTTTVYRLQYNAPDDWREYVVSATPVETQWGSFSGAGSYREVKGQSYIEYNSVGGETTTEEIAEGELIAPHSMFVPMSFAKLEEEGFREQAARANTGVRVCFNDQCQDDAAGWVFTKGGNKYPYADDVRGIPLRASGAVVTEVRISADQKAVVR